MKKEQRLFFVGQSPDASLLRHDEALMFPMFQKNFSRWLPANRDADILDFGCGYGTFLRFLAQNGFRACCGFDPDERCSAFARNHVSAVVPVSQEPFSFLAEKTNSFDFVACLNVAEYFGREEMIPWFTALKDALRPGGTLMLTVPNAAGITGLTDYIQDPYMRSFFTDIALRDICRLAGLELVFLGGVKIPPKGIKRLAWQCARAFWVGVMKGIYLVERGASDRNPRCFDAMLLLVGRRPD